MWSQDRKQLSLGDLQRGTSVKAIIQLSYVWTNNNAFGATWTLLQLLVVNPPPKLASAFAFIEEEEDDPGA